jgi:hypothetical protein
MRFDPIGERSNYRLPRVILNKTEMSYAKVEFHDCLESYDCQGIN